MSHVFDVARARGKRKPERVSRRFKAFCFAFETTLRGTLETRLQLREARWRHVTARIVNVSRFGSGPGRAAHVGWTLLRMSPRTARVRCGTLKNCVKQSDASGYIRSGMACRDQAASESLWYRSAALESCSRTCSHAVDVSRRSPKHTPWFDVVVILLLCLLLVSALLALFVVCGLVGPSTHMRVRHL